MNGIILAAGRGSRMGTLTGDQPKCFTELGGKRLIDWQLSALAAAGVQTTAIVTGYRAEAFAGLADVHFHNPNWANTQMVQSMLAAEAWLTAGPCVVSYADIVYEPDAILGLKSSAEDIAITYHTGWRALWEARFADPLSDAETFRLTPTGLLQEIGKRAASLDDIEGQYMGLLKLTPTGYAVIRRFISTLPPERQARLDVTSLLSGLLEAGQPIGAVAVSSRWYEVDTESDWRLYTGLVARGA
ncbi:MAG: hypothetical protein RJA70_78 [Pseudomonadota bacterium]|jgi:choline kinase